MSSNGSNIGALFLFSFQRALCFSAVNNVASSKVVRRVGQAEYVIGSDKARVLITKQQKKEH